MKRIGSWIEQKFQHAAYKSFQYSKSIRLKSNDGNKPVKQYFWLFTRFYILSLLTCTFVNINDQSDFLSLLPVTRLAPCRSPSSSQSNLFPVPQKPIEGMQFATLEVTRKRVSCCFVWIAECMLALFNFEATFWKEIQIPWPHSSSAQTAMRWSTSNQRQSCS